uniref:Ulp1 protease family, C-terminal catalytic domain containing protein n=1 Tax=Solanum tuberosum TaxID=4113 RepID=M1BE07_SOLTU
MGARPKFEMFMENIFTENDCSNVQPTQEEIRSLDLPNNSHVPPTQPATSDVNHEEVQPDEVPGFEEFSSKPLEKLLWRSTQVSTTRSTPPPKRRKVAHPTKNNVPKATQPDEQPNQPFQTPDSHPPQVDNVFGVPHNAIFRRTISDNAGLEELKGHMKSYDNGGIYMPHIVDDSVNKDNVDPQSASDQFFQQIISPIQMNFATVDHDVDASAVEVEKRHVIEENIANLTNSDDFLSDSQLPTQLPVKESAHNLDTKTPAPHNRMPSKILQSPYVNTFGSSDKGKGEINDDIRPYTPFKGCGITYQVSSI